MFKKDDILKAIDLLKSIKDCEVENSLNKSKELLQEIFGSTFVKDIDSNGMLRYKSLTGADESVKYWGLLYDGAATSGPYENFSLVIMPFNTQEKTSNQLLISFGIGTGGVTDDATWLAMPWVKRSIHNLLRYTRSQKLNKTQTETFLKDDLLDENSSVPSEIIANTGDFSMYVHLWKKYGKYLQSICIIDLDENGATTFLSHLILYGKFREWNHLKKFNDILNLYLIPTLYNYWRGYPSEELIKSILMDRKFIILQGPPGTGKTYLSVELAKSLKRKEIISDVEIIQFHSSLNYEDFVSGLKPDTTNNENLVFKQVKGPLVSCIEKAQSAKAVLLIIDEINRADIAKVLGEAINLFEPGERRVVRLRSGQPLKMPDNLYVIGTMNTADRSIAILDYAIRRRFAFIDIWPSKEILERFYNNSDNDAAELALELFDHVQTIFYEYADDVDLHLQPGHSYFMAENKQKLFRKLNFELIPLLREYISEGRLVLAKNSLTTFIEMIENKYNEYQD